MGLTPAPFLPPHTYSRVCCMMGVLTAPLLLLLPLIHLEAVRQLHSRDTMKRLPKGSHMRTSKCTTFIRIRWYVFKMFRWLCSPTLLVGWFSFAVLVVSPRSQRSQVWGAGVPCFHTFPVNLFGHAPPSAVAPDFLEKSGHGTCAQYLCRGRGCFGAFEHEVSGIFASFPSFPRGTTLGYCSS